MKRLIKKNEQLLRILMQILGLTVIVFKFLSTHGVVDLQTLFSINIMTVDFETMGAFAIVLVTFLTDVEAKK